MPRFGDRVLLRWACSLPLAAASLTAVPAWMQCQPTPSGVSDAAPAPVPLRAASSHVPPTRTWRTLSTSPTAPAEPPSGAVRALSRWNSGTGDRATGALPPAPAPAPAPVPGAAGAPGGDKAFSDLFAAAVDCQRKSCDEGKTHKFQNMFSQMQKRAESLPAAGAGRGSKSGAGGGGSAGGRGGVGIVGAATAAAAAGKRVASEQFTCPSKDDIGMCTWTLLHLIASQYPESPTEETKRHAVGLIEGLAWFYPCAYCREDFREAIRQIPPRVNSKREFVLWLCEQHNLVNTKLGKDTVPCDYEALEDRWTRPCLKEE